jgi:hypothetical protein
MLSFIIPVVLVIVALLIVTAVMGSSRKSPIQEQQDAYAREQRERRRAERAARGEANWTHAWRRGFPAWSPWRPGCLAYPETQGRRDQNHGDRRAIGF